MPVGFIQSLERKYRFAPRVKNSLKLVAGPAGEEEEAVINDVGVTNDEIISWDGGNERLKTTGVKSGKLSVINGVTAGTASPSKAVILNSNKDITGINQLTLSVLKANTRIEAPSITASTSIETGTLRATGNVELGKIIENVKVDSTKKFQLYYGASTPRDIVRRASSSSVVVYVGNSADRLYLETSAFDLYHRRAGTNHKIWDAYNHGAGSGLDADKLDGQQGSYYRNADNINAGTLALARLPMKVGTINFGDVPSSGELRQVAHGMGTSNIRVFLTQVTVSNQPGDNDIRPLRVVAITSTSFYVFAEETAGETQSLSVHWLAVRTF